jgi:hypothetical protein
MMFTEMTLAGIKKYVTEQQVKFLETIGWKRVPGADQGHDAVKEDAPSQLSPKTRKPRKKKNETNT